ncbi:MAG: hypothetical protein JXR63_00855 [Spirochaetales bacterium]|nr:hypothetical protein [Spirochaetales bacterium]
MNNYTNETDFAEFRTSESAIMKRWEKIFLNVCVSIYLPFFFATYLLISNKDMRGNFLYYLLFDLFAIICSIVFLSKKSQRVSVSIFSNTLEIRDLRKDSISRIRVQDILSVRTHWPMSVLSKIEVRIKGSKFMIYGLERQDEFLAILQSRILENGESILRNIEKNKKKAMKRLRFWQFAALFFTIISGLIATGIFIKMYYVIDDLFTLQVFVYSEIVLAGAFFFFLAQDFKNRIYAGNSNTMVCFLPLTIFLLILYIGVASFVLY